MADELIDIYDENNTFLGIQKMKSEAHKDGLWHSAAHLWIYNAKGEILLQLRAKEKALYPDMWDISVAGHISAGEDPVTAALRESEEEIGLKFKRNELDFFMIKKHRARFRTIKNNEFYHIFFVKFDGDIEPLKLQQEEVQKIRLLPIKSIEEELKTKYKSYVPHGDYWVEILNEVKKRLAA